MTDQLAFDVIATDGRIERRRYAPYIVAEVDVSAGGPSDAARLGFRPLANYIFGANLPREKIAMTAPVTAQARGQTIAMTAPVTAEQSSAEGIYTVRFSMPAEWTMETLPTPTDAKIRLVAVDREDVLAIGYRGRNDRRRIESGAAQLIAYAAAKDLVVWGAPTWAGYSSPAVPLPLRRWEMLLRVSDEG